MSILYEYARELGLELYPVQLERFEAYYRLLVEWNEKFNLTSITAYTDVQSKHFCDSLAGIRVLGPPPLTSKRLMDVGSGAGFPGVPLAIAYPQLTVTLLEATGKKVRFLDQVVRELGLENAVAVKGRAEELAHSPDYRAHFDFATARALAEMRTLAEYALPFLRVSGVLLAYKSLDAAAEAEAAAHAIHVLGGQLREVMPVQLPDRNDVRHLVVVDQVSPTPDLYPRRSGLPEKKPL